LTGTGTLQ